MSGAMFLEHLWLEINETAKEEGYRINWIRCKICGKEILRYRELYRIDRNDLHKHYPIGVEIISFEPCDHHDIIKSQKPPELYEYKIEDYYIIPK